MSKGLITKVLIVGMLLASTVTAYGACFYGWFLPKPLEKPVSIREGSTGHGTGHGYYFIGRTHSGGGYRGGK